ncbi:MAG: class I SAM-dependent methyltransferase, partial [Maribacter sp.]
MKVKYDKIGIDYNLTRKADKYLTEQLLFHLDPKENGLYLDIGCGTGNYTNELQKRGFQCIGIDPSIEMLEKAKSNNHQIDWRIGTAEKTGLADNSMNGIIGSLTIHHWTDLKKGFSELYRVLKPEGRIVIFTSTPKQMNGYWL